MSDGRDCVLEDEEVVVVVAAVVTSAVLFLGLGV